MKILIVLAVLLAFGATAQARVAPLESQAIVTAFGDSTYSRSAAQREAEYFRAPQSPALAEHNYPCRLPLRIFEKTRLAQSCR